MNQLYHDTSLVPHKHDAGGQSQRRFERGREEELKHWLKEISESISNLNKYEYIYLGCNSIYRNKIKMYLSIDIIRRIILEKSVSLDDNCLWELINIPRYT